MSELDFVFLELYIYKFYYIKFKLKVINLHNIKKKTFFSDLN